MRTVSCAAFSRRFKDAWSRYAKYEKSGSGLPSHRRRRLKRLPRSACQRAMIPRRWRCGAPHRSNIVSDEFDFSAMLRQAQDLRQKLKQIQIDAAEKTVEAQSGGGMVRVVVDGGMRGRKIEIDPSIGACDDQAVMEDLIVVAINDGLRRAQELVAEEMGKLGPMAGMNLPPGIFAGPG